MNAPAGKHGGAMGLLDKLLSRERHVLQTPLSPDQCRLRLGGLIPTFGTQMPSVNPFVVFWTNADHARLRLLVVGRRSGWPPDRMARVHVVPDGPGTVVETTIQMAPSQLAIALFVLAAFGLVGILLTVALLRQGLSLHEALSPFGYLALFVLLAVIALVVWPSDQPAVLLDNLQGVLGASSVDGVPTWNTAPGAMQPPAFAPPPPRSPPLPTQWSPPIAAPRGRGRFRRHSTFISPLPFDECVRRIGPDSGDTDARWVGSGGTGLSVAWTSADEVELSKSGLYRRSAKHLLRVRLEPRPDGTLVETNDTMSPGPRRYLAHGAILFGGAGLYLLRMGRTLAVLTFLLPIVLFLSVGLSAQYFLNRLVTARQHAFLVATLQSMLEATPVEAE